MSPTSLWICAVAASGPVSASVPPTRIGPLPCAAAKRGSAARPSAPPAAAAMAVRRVIAREGCWLIVSSPMCSCGKSIDLRARALHELGPFGDLALVERQHLVGLHRALLDALVAQPRSHVGQRQRGGG